MKTKLAPMLVGLVVLVSTVIPAHAQFITYSSYGYTIAPPSYDDASVEYQSPVVYQQPVVYNAPVTYNAPVYYVHSGSAQSYESANCESGRSYSGTSSVFVMGGGSGSYSYANHGCHNPDVVIFGSRGGWFGR